MNTGLRRYQAIQKAAKSVAEGKPGAKTRLTAAKKAYLTAVEKTAKKDAADKIASAKKKAEAAAKVPGIGRAKAKPKTRKTTAKKSTATRRKATTTRKRK